MSDETEALNSESEAKEAAETAAKPAPKKPVVKKVAAKGAEGENGEPAAPAKKAAPKKPPAKPAAAGKAKKGGDGRRLFLFTSIGAAWLFFTGAAAAFGLGLLRFMFPNVLAEPPSQFNTGYTKDQFDPGVVNERWKTEFQVWLVSLAEERKLVALSTVCTHLGCTPSWLEQEQKFKCPCHGSGFYKDGVNFEGPAPRPLERFAIYEIDGVVVVDKSKKFQYELGQWDDSQSFLRT